MGVMKRAYTSGWRPGRHGRGTAYDAEIARRKAGGRRGGAELIVTGQEHIDRVLRTMEPKHVAKAVRRAAKDTITLYVRPAYRRNILAAGFVETGATRDAAVPRPIRGNRKTLFGHELHIDRQKVVEERRARGGRIGYDQKRKEDFFYPIAIEFGDQDTPPQRPLLRALLEQKAEALAVFYRYLTLAIAEVTGSPLASDLRRASRMNADQRRIDEGREASL